MGGVKLGTCGKVCQCPLHTCVIELPPGQSSILREIGVHLAEHVVNPMTRNLPEKRWGEPSATVLDGGLFESKESRHRLNLVASYRNYSRWT